MSQTKAQLVTDVSSGFNVTGVVTATEYKGAGQNLSGIITTGLGNQTIAGNLTLDGNLTVKGSQTIINSDTLDVQDKTVGIASTSTPTSATQNNSGIEIYGPSNVTIKYDDQKGGIGINTGLTVTGVVTATSFSGSGANLTSLPAQATIANNADNRVVTGGSGVNLNGEANLTFDGKTLTSSNGSYPETTELTRQISAGVGNANRYKNRYIKIRNTYTGSGHGGIPIVWEANADGSNNKSYGGIGIESDGSIILSNKAAGSAVAIGSALGMSERIRFRSSGDIKFTNASLTEKVKITAGKLSDNQNINLDNGMVHYFTTAETTTSTPNITASAGINTIMSTGDTMVVTLITTAAAGAYSAQLTIEGAATTENWIGGEVPAAGGASGVDIYSYTIIKTGSAAYTVIGNLSKTSA